MSTGGGASSQSGKKRKEFREYSQEEVEEHREEKVPQGEEEYEEEIESESDSSDDDMEEEEGAEGERSTAGEDDASGSNTDGSQSRKRNRKPTKVGTIRQEFTAVTTAGVPSEPERFAEGYGHQVATILRNTVPITTINLRSRDNNHYCQLLLNKLHGRYKFPDPYNNQTTEGTR